MKEGLSTLLKLNTEIPSPQIWTELHSSKL
jgi:hypothetical protein